MKTMSNNSSIDCKLNGGERKQKNNLIKLHCVLLGIYSSAVPYLHTVGQYIAVVYILEQCIGNLMHISYLINDITHWYYKTFFEGDH